MAEQLVLPFLRAARLPFLVRHSSVQRLARRTLGRYVDAAAPGSAFLVGKLAEDEALLAELRARCGAAARGKPRRGRPSKEAAAAFAATLEGRRVHRLMDELSERIAHTQDLALCG